jgi:hypothetical protein
MILRRLRPFSKENCLFTIEMRVPEHNGSPFQSQLVPRVLNDFLHVTINPGVMVNAIVACHKRA